MARRLGIALTAAGLLSALAACGNSGSATPVAGTTKASAPAPSTPGTSSPGPGGSQAPVAAESNPPGDIPDTTVYVTYQSPPGHLLIKVPEGWSRKTTPASSTFTSNLNSISVAWMPLAAPPTVHSVQATAVPALKAKSLAFRLQSVRAVKLAGGPAVETIYQVNSPPNGVTGRQYRLVIERFELYRHGRGAVIDLSSAVGSDNVDPWRIVSESFRWK
ncbi:MAG: lipoprotein [Actinomycetia bacterium]|nr:lipoprotein [Actinomycetes bacterium]